MFCHICIRFKPYNEGTRKGVNNYMTDSYFFFPPEEISVRNSVSCSRRTSPLRTYLFERISQSVYVFAFETEEDDYLSCLWSRLLPRRQILIETTWVFLRTLSNCLLLKTLLHFPVNVGFLSFLTHGDWSLIPFPQHRYGRIQTFKEHTSETVAELSCSSCSKLWLSK